LAIHKDVKKRLKTSLKARMHNREIKTHSKTLIKNVETNPVPENLKKMYSHLDKASRKKIIHKNRASRIKSRLAKLLNKTSKPGAESTVKA